jgi:hypothetical protein
MARRELRILPYKGDRDYQYYLDGLKVNGKRKRLFFKTEKEALEELKKRGKQLRKEGEEGQAISADLRILAAKCADGVHPKPLTECCRGFTSATVGSHDRSPCRRLLLVLRSP